ncbi:9832_t:CDS:2, partial [Funneliformis geosporum]
MVDIIKEHITLSDDDNSSIYVALSPDGELAVNFNSETYDLQVYSLEINKDIDKLESREIKNDVYNLEYNEIRNTHLFTINVDQMKINAFPTKVAISFSLAISNYAKIGKDLIAFIALSRFHDKDMKKVCENKDEVSNENSIDPERGYSNSAETFVFSTKSKALIKTSVEICGGVVRFLKNNFPKEAYQSTNLIVMNASGISKVFIQHKSIENNFDKFEYEFPTIIQVKINKLYQNLPCTRFLNTIVEKNYLFVEDYKFQRLEIGTNYISIHLMENGLKVATKEFIDARKILSISFINNDEKLFVVTEEPLRRLMFGIFLPLKMMYTRLSIILNIFSSLQKSSHSIACSNEIILSFLPDSIRAYRADKLIPKFSSQTDDFKVIKEFNVNVKKEPWVYDQPTTIGKINKSYLDEKETIQLIIGETTVQVWRKDSTNKKVLDYIWMNHENFTIVSLKKNVSKCEFYLLLSWTDYKNQVHNNMIHWPNEAHVLKDACVAMEHLYKRRDEPVGTRNLSKYKDLVVCTERLIKTCIKNNPDLWSLSEVRYEIMANIIRSKSKPLLHNILFDHKEAVRNKQDKTKVSRFLHIPREYEWSTRTKESDLMLAINITSDSSRRDTVIVAMLLEYYSNNAENDTGWMFTITKAFPSLNNSSFEPYLKELLYKPCFGSKEEYVDSKFVNQNDKEIKAIIIPQAFAVLLLWFEFVNSTATYINMILNILKAIWPFLIFMFIVVIAFGHAMHIILEDPKLISLVPNGNTFVIKSPNPAFADTTIEQVINLTDPIENYYRQFIHSVLGVYFWVLGRWDQLEEWDFWPIH